MRRWLISTPPFATPLWSRHASSSSSRRPFPVLSQASLDLPPPPDVVLQHHREHRDLVALCRAGGGEKGVARHTHINKKILVRERLAHIFDSAGKDAFAVTDDDGRKNASLLKTFCIRVANDTAINTMK